MSETVVKQIFKSVGAQPIQMFISGSTYSAIADISTYKKEGAIYTIPEAGLISAIKFYQLQLAIEGFTNLKQNWDSYNADTISKLSIERALEILNQLNRDAFFSKGIDINVFPMRNGGIQFEFDASDLSAELEIDQVGEMEFILFDEKSDIIEKISVPGYDLSLINLFEDAVCE